MPILPADLEIRLATLQGLAGNEQPSAPGGSNGKWVSTTALDNATLGNVFPEITSEERLAGNVDYQCLFLLNNHPVLTLSAAKIWLSSQTPGVADIAIAVDNVPATPVGSESQQATYIADKDAVPAGVSAFSAPTTEGTGLSLGSIGPGEAKAFWVRRTAYDSVRQDDGVILTIHGDEAQAT